MEIAWDFDTLKDIIIAIAIPIIGIVGGIIAFLWPKIVSYYKKKRFTNLMLRELSEARPYPEKPTPGGKWSDHMNKQFMHRRIFEDPSENKDLILDLDPDTAYKVGQLLAALKDSDDTQWIHYMNEISQKYRKKEPQLTAVYNDWQSLIISYSQLRSRDL
jgi:hypothetical protein